MVRERLLEGFSGGFVVMLATWAIPFGPVLGGAVTGYVDGTDRRRGLRVGADAGLVGFCLVLVMIRRRRGDYLLDRFLSAFGVENFALFLAGTFVYVVLFSALGGCVGAALRDSHGHDSESNPVDW